jgi:cobaltochelatase CobS
MNKPANLNETAILADHLVGHLIGVGMTSETAELEASRCFAKVLGNDSAIDTIFKARAMLSKTRDYTKELPPLPDSLVATLDSLKCAIPVDAAPSDEPIVVATPVAKLDEIPDDKAQMVNMLLSGVSGGKIVSINDLIGFVNGAASERASLQSQLEAAKSAAVSVAAATAIPKAGTADDLDFEVVMVNGNDIDWGQGKGKRSAVIDFDVPTIVWRTKVGDVVRHPLCPDIDVHYKFSPKELCALLDAVSNRDIPWVYGHTGSGKTTKIEQLAARLGYPFVRINYDAEISRTDLLGKTDIKAEAGGTTSYFKPGILPQWVDKPCFILHDELDFIRSEISYALQRVLEDNGAIRLDEDGGRLLKVGPLCFQFAAANTRGQGDEMGMYPGAKVQTQAFLDRFKPFIEVEYLKKDAETNLLVRRVSGLPAKTATSLVKFANEVRAGFMQGEIMQTLSPRGLVYMAKFISKFAAKTSEREAVEMALEMGVLSKATAQDKQKIREYANRCFVY